MKTLARMVLHPAAIAFDRRRATRPPEMFDDFSRSASAEMPGDNRRMAATAEEGTAHKLVTCKCGRTMPNSEDRGDSRKDGKHSPNAYRDGRQGVTP